MVLIVVGTAVPANAVVYQDGDRFLGYRSETYAPISTWDVPAKHIPIVVEAEDGSRIELAYCFSLELGWPPVGKENAAWYTLDHQAVLSDYAVYNVPETVMERIIYNGYPRNNGALQGQLTDVQMHMITQLAIWRFTDNMSNFVAVRELENFGRFTSDEMLRYGFDVYLRLTGQDDRVRSDVPALVDVPADAYLYIYFKWNLLPGPRYVKARRSRVSSGKRAVGL
ncbi:Cys-Gln thioester bond-forming surface protein [Corynebacterium belfantii]|uniref:Cys-Gln thioester bond-forming surface protein n=1 Tax=Corynebacterium belfantii TaxID=2014537 RepID=UPI0035A8C562